MKSLPLAIALLALAMGTAAASPPTYLPGVPLATQVNASVRDCRMTDKWTMPIITWGADEVTLEANGGLHTTPDSILGKRGLDITLNRQDDFLKQVKAYLNCDSPFLRATLGMAIQTSDLTEADPRTHMVAIYQHSWSAGGDVLVARGNIQKPADLKGKTIVVQRYGPHVDYILKVLADAGLSPSDVTIKMVNDLTGTGSETPANALRSDGTVDAVMVISPDAASLTSDDTVGTGAEGSVKGAHVLLSTKSANRIITDIIFVRRDFYDANKAQLAQFSEGMLDAEASAHAMARANGPDWAALMKMSGKLLLDDETDTADAIGMWGDAETTGRAGNLKFFTDPSDPRGFGAVSREVQGVLRSAGYVSSSSPIALADWDWNVITGVKTGAATVIVPNFDPAAVSHAVGEMHEQGTIDSNTLFSLNIHFKPNQMSFPLVDYASDFDKVMGLASTYGGAVITVEGHADPMAYLQALNNGADRLVLSRMVQSGRNLSIQRAQAVRDAVIAEARAKGVALDPSQFDVVGLGYDDPVTGICGDRPCMPKTQAEWLSNMLVRFRVVNVEAEAAAFAPSR